MRYLLFLSPALAVAAPALADEMADDRKTITVIASGSAIDLSQTGQSISIVGRNEIDSIQGADLTRVLERLPGVSLSRTGGIGAQTGLFVRGANSDQVLVLVDGVRVADYASPGGGYDLGNMLSGNLERVDLLRGSNSVIWGSQAIGGVLALTTREADGVEASAEYGAYDTAQLTGTLGVSEDAYAASLSAGYTRTDGFSAQAGGEEKDGLEQWQISVKTRARLAEGLNLRAVGRYTDGKLDIDQFGPDSPDTQHTKEGSGRIGLDYESDGISLAGGYAYSEVRRDYVNLFGPSFFKGYGHRLDLKGRVDLPSSFALDFGGDSEWTRAQSTFDPSTKSRLTSGHSLLGWYTDRVSLAAGARLDDHSRFGTHWTFGANGSVALVDGWRLRGSIGEGFKAPTLYQLFGSFVGNPALAPEKSRSYEAGIEKGNRNAGLHFAATWFLRNTRNLIDLDSSFQYQNVAQARAQGFEVELGAQVSERFHAQAAYTYLNARDRTLGRDLARRPRNAVTLSADWQTPLGGLGLGGDLRFASKAVEYDFLGTPSTLDSHVVVTVRASVPVTERIEMFGRVENIGDEHYELASGFNTLGRSAYVGARARF